MRALTLSVRLIRQAIIDHNVILRFPEIAQDYRPRVKDVANCTNCTFGIMHFRTNYVAFLSHRTQSLPLPFIDLLGRNDKHLKLDRTDLSLLDSACSTIIHHTCTMRIKI